MKLFWRLFWVVVATIVAGVVVLILEYSFFFQHDRTESPLKVEAVRAVKSISVEDSSIYGKTQIESEIHDLRELLRIADKIYGSTPRNEEYSKIIDLALSEEKTEFALNVAKKIYGADTSNKEYSKIVSRCLSLGRYEFAVKVADEVFGSNPRNKEYGKIITAVMEKRKGPPFDVDAAEDR